MRPAKAWAASTATRACQAACASSITSKLAARSGSISPLILPPQLSPRAAPTARYHSEHATVASWQVADLPRGAITGTRQTGLVDREQADEAGDSGVGMLGCCCIGHSGAIPARRAVRRQRQV